MAETPPVHRHLTADQMETLRAIDEFHRANGFAPSMREMRDALGLYAVSSVFSRLGTLRRYGLVEWRDGQVRSLKLTPAGHEYLLSPGAIVSDR